MEAFLRRNPSIQTLNVSGIVIPSPTPQLREPILSDLYAIEANPKIIVWLLGYKDACFQKLKVVTITPRSGEFDHDQFYEVFEALALHSQMDALRLGLNFIPESDSHKWMEKHTLNLMAPSGSAIGCIANRVTVLTIKTNYSMRLDNGDEPMVKTLPQFLALFLSLEKVNFGEQPFSGEIYLKGCKDLFKNVVSLCPRLQTVSINGTVIDLAYLGV